MSTRLQIHLGKGQENKLYNVGDNNLYNVGDVREIICIGDALTKVKE